MHTVVLQGLLSVFVGSGSVSAVEPSIAARRSVVLCSSLRESPFHAYSGPARITLCLRQR